MSKFELFQGKGDQWYFRILGGNGECLAVSEGYVSKSNARRGACDCQDAVMEGDLLIEEVAADPTDDDGLENDE